MHNTIKILSTKKLTQSQIELLGDINIYSEDFIKIILSPNVELPTPIARAIFTSQNAVKSCLINALDFSEIDEVYCVGDKTEELLLNNNVTVKLKSISSKQLAKDIISFKNRSDITYFCGNLYRGELPLILESNKISVDIIEVYRTELTPHSLSDKYDGILFFSPTAVQSYTQLNNYFESVAFCIGETTGVEARKYFKNVAVAETPLIENVIKLAVQYFRL